MSHNLDSKLRGSLLISDKDMIMALSSSTLGGQNRVPKQAKNLKVQ